MKWAIDLSHSQIQFAVKHLGISTVRGNFNQFEGTIDEENGDVTGATVEIDVASINTGNAQRDGHLRSGELFHTAEYPTATFHLTSFQKSGDDVTAVGNLTLLGVTHSVNLRGEINGPVNDPWGNAKVSASLTTVISRKNWGLVYNGVLETGGMLLSDEIKLTIEVQAAALVEATV